MNNSIHARFLIKRAGFTLDADLKIANRGVTALYGHSGSGKTTILRCIAGLERAPEGFLCVNGTIWQNSNYFLPTYKRPLGYVFQEACLFPHLTVKGNLSFGMKRVRGASEASLKKAIELLGISHLLDRKPGGLSGGEKQRVAIARAVAINPSILLMDEPLASLDIQRKKEVIPYLKKLHNELDIPFVYVSHHPDEVAQLADNLIVIENGSVIADGPIEQVLARVDMPLRIGEDAGVVLDASVAEIDNTWHLCRMEFAGGSVWSRDTGISVGEKVRIRILARDVSISKGPLDQISIQNSLQGSIDALGDDEHPGLALVRVKIGESFILSRVSQRAVSVLQLKSGDPVWVHVKSAVPVV